MQEDSLVQFNHFLENALDPIIGINENGMIVNLNNCAEEVLGWQKKDAIGKSFIELIVAPLQQNGLEKQLKLALKDGKSAHQQPSEILANRRNGTQFPALISFTLMKINKAPVLYVFIKDITQTKYSVLELKQSEQRYRQLVENIKDYAIFMLDRSGVIISWNLGAEKIKGYKREEIIGKHFSIFYLKDDIESGKPQFELKVAVSDGKYEEEGWRVRKDGTLFWANILITAIWDETGKLQGFAKVTRDLTSKRQFEEALRQVQERYRILVESVPDYAIFMLDQKGRISSWNKGAERMMGYRTEEVIGESFNIFHLKEDDKTPKSKKEIETAIKVGYYEEKCWYLRKDKSKFFANVIITTILNELSRPAGFSVIVRDISEISDKKNPSKG